MKLTRSYRQTGHRGPLFARYAGEDAPFCWICIGGMEVYAPRVRKTQ